MPNIIAYLALWIWPAIANALSKKYNKIDTVILLILIPYLFLPVKVAINTHLPGIPGIDKTIIIGFSAFFVIWAKYGRPTFLPHNKVMKTIIFLSLVFPLCSWLTNTDTIVKAETNSISFGLSFGYFTNQLFYVLSNIFVFGLGYAYLKTEESHLRLLKLLSIFGIFYGLLVLFEIKMSPILHTKIYGFFPHDWFQAKRQGGFRALVFLGHGLLISVFLSIAFISTIVLVKNKQHSKIKMNMLTLLYLLFVLLMNKTWSGLIYSTIAFCLLYFVPNKRIIQIAAIIVAFVLTYPILRANDLIPVDDILAKVEQKSAERAQSLGFRFSNEAVILKKANERPWFGWGGNAREKVMHPETGFTAISDGTWVIYFSKYGWLGYSAIFGLLGLPILLFAKYTLNRKAQNISPYTSCLILILALNLLDLIPNSSISPLTFLFAGAILGRLDETHSSR